MSQRAPTDMSPMDSAVELCGVTKQYTQWQRGHTSKSMLQNLIRPEKRVVTALDDVSFAVRRGEFVAYAGPNGAGKSTTMKLLSGMLLPGSGEIEVLGLSPYRQRRALMQRLGILFGNRTELWWDHPVIQSFEWKRVVWNIPEDVYTRNLRTVTELLELGGLLKTFARELSLGQRMRADLAMMLLHSPEIVLLDEPTLGLDVVAKRQMIRFLQAINRESGVTILVTSHDMDDLEEMARRIILIAGGKIAYDGDFEGLRGIAGNHTRIRVYTGHDVPAHIPGATLLSCREGVSLLEVDLDRTPISAVLQELSRLTDIRDIEIEKMPIEQVIAELYKSWQSV